MQISGTATELCPPPYLAALSSQNDSQNQLISEVYYNGSGSANTNITQAYYYTYDTAGNLLTVEEGTVNSGGTITKTTVQTFTYGTGDWKDLLTAVNGNTIIYEGQTYNESTGEIEGAATGNPTSYQTHGTFYDMSWANGRQLVYISCYEEHWQAAYTYDAEGIRTSKNDDGVLHTYVTQNGKVVRETIGTGSSAKVLDFIYDESGKPFALKYSTNNGSSFTTYYYVLNLQGDVVKLVTASGTAVATYTYDAWGNILSASGSMAAINPLRYRGYYYDTETGFYYLQSRYYDPSNHRFINADSYASTGQGIAGTNMFTYCNNSPVSMYDSDGKCSRFLGFLWKIDCGKATCKDSKNYNASAKKVAVLYDGRTSGYFGGAIGGVGFKDQGYAWATALEEKYAVDECSFTSMEGFINAWNSLEGEYESVVILMHGYAGGLSCAGETISNSVRGDYDFFDLNSVSINTVYLFSCNGATISSDNDSVAGNLAYITGGGVWAMNGGSIKYPLFGYIPYSDDGAWSYTRGRTTVVYN